MSDLIARRTFLDHALRGGAAAAMGSTAMFIASCESRTGHTETRRQISTVRGTEPSLSSEEKARLKAELQRELERKVYAVDEELFRKINRAQNPKRYEGHERSHVPKVVAPRKVRRLESFTVKVEVGVEEIHEMQTFHYVDWISLSVDAVQVNHVTVTPLFNRPIVTFEMILERSATLTAQEHCNLHGIWESEPWRVQVV